MPRHRINDIDLYCEIVGDGPPVVLVHGGWIDHRTWRYVAPALAEDHLVVSYDRRGHSRSERPGRPGSRRLDEDDLAALVASLGAGPAHLVGNSYGASIALGMATRYPDLTRTIAGHEPPLLDAIEPGRAATVRRAFDRTAALLREGHLDAGAAHFVEHIAIGPGGWGLVPIDDRRVMVANASTVLEMLDDPRWATPPEPAWPDVPVLLTAGDASPPWFRDVAGALARGHAVERRLLAGAGHVPHLTHPGEYATALRQFIDRAVVRRPGRGPGRARGLPFVNSWRSAREVRRETTTTGGAVAADDGGPPQLGSPASSAASVATAIGRSTLSITAFVACGSLAGWR